MTGVLGPLSKFFWKKAWLYFDVATERYLHAAGKNISHELQRRALETTAKFVEANIPPNTPTFGTREALLDFALRSSPSAGLYCEFGVYMGETLNRIAAYSRNTVHGFDSFEGLPEDWKPAFEQGSFRVDPGRLRISQNAKLHIGWFQDTLPAFARDNPDNLSFAHIDCDLYTSTKTIFETLGDRIVPGTVLLFDEFFNYPGWENHEYKAFNEFSTGRNLRHKYLAYCHNGEQMCISIV